MISAFKIFFALALIFDGYRLTRKSMLTCCLALLVIQFCDVGIIF